MRVPAKALPCLLFCVACASLLPSQASARTTSPSRHEAAASPRVHHAAPLQARLHDGPLVARRHAKSHRAAPNISSAAPRDASNRFLMTQNGKQMTADDFEAWMKARGIRVAKGAPEATKAAD